MSQVKFRAGLYADYVALATKSADSLYFCTDTHQIFKGDAEYTKGTTVVDATPTTTTVGDTGHLYAYNGNLYLCTGVVDGEYQYIRVANINDEGGTITSITVGEGLANEAGDANPITTTGTIKHAVATGAAVTTDGLSDETPDFGESFDIVGVATDKFGHVTGVNTHTVTLPEETPVTVETATGTATTLAPGDSFTVVTEVEVGAADQAVKRTATEFTLPDDTTYTFETGSVEGKIKVTPSSGSAYEVLVKGWEDLAKKSELSSVFVYKGKVATVAALPKTAEVGYVYLVEDKSKEYVCIEASAEGKDAVYEELGPVIDLSPYALVVDVIQRVDGATGEVPKFNEDGTVSSTGFTLGKSVPSDAVFTDTTYDDATQTTHGLMSAADKVKLDGMEAGGQVNVLEGVQVDGTDLTIDSNKKVNVTLGSFGVTATAAELNDVANKVSKSGDTITGDLTVEGTITGDLTGNVTGDLTGNADTATKATQDAAGNVITTTYATKTEVSNALSWIPFED